MLELKHKAPTPQTHHKIDTIESLAEHLQWALSLELSTIPPYLCAAYSVSDNSSAAYTLVRSVAIEEMLHMMLVANLMNSIGSPPSLAREHVPTYPGWLPHHIAGGPLVQLQPLSPQLAATVFMPIEQPEVSPKAPAEGDLYQTIGQFYKAIEQGFEICVRKFGEKGVFGKDTGFQRSDVYFGNGGGKLVVVKDLVSARKAIREITEQGEGAEWPDPPQPGEEPFGALDHYGLRSDGTYGPILGTPWELSHYRKFQQIATGLVTIPTTYPMMPNPVTDRLEGDLRRLSALFDASYTLVLRALQRSFRSKPTPVDYFFVVFPVMHFVLPALAELLMQTPIDQGADATLGPNAGPSFAYDPRPVSHMIDEAEYLRAHPLDLGTDYTQLWQQTLDATLKVLRGTLESTGRDNDPMDPQETALLTPPTN